MSINEKEILKSWQKESPKNSPGPESYWKTERFSQKQKNQLNKNIKKFLVNFNKDGTKSILIDRRITDKAIFKPTSSIIF